MGALISGPPVGASRQGIESVYFLRKRISGCMIVGMLVGALISARISGRVKLLGASVGALHVGGRVRGHASGGCSGAVLGASVCEVVGPPWVVERVLQLALGWVPSWSLAWLVPSGNLNDIWATLSLIHARDDGHPRGN